MQAACSCNPSALANLGPGMLWQGTERLGLKEIAALAAPVLWFSGDEPLIGPDLPLIPAPHPCDAPSSHAVVYYQVTHLVLRGAARVTRPEEDDPEFFDKVDRLILKYFFYYPEDSGVGGHVHDLEAAEFEIVLERTAACRGVRLVRVEGLAHGSRCARLVADRPTAVRVGDRRGGVVGKAGAGPLPTPQRPTPSA